MNTIVNFELAKLLKEKGFDKSVRYSYGHKINPHIAYPNENYFIPVNFNSITVGLNYKNLYSAPTITEVVMWLYENHGIWIYTCIGYNWEYVIVKANSPSIQLANDGTYNSPTEAYEAAIGYTLNNLI